MRKTRHVIKNKTWLICCLGMLILVCLSTHSNGAIRNLITWNTVNWLDSLGAALPDGSVIYVMGSTDTVNDGMAAQGDCFIADSTQGDDVLLAELETGAGAVPTGRFLGANIFIEDTVISNIYFRIFDASGQIVGTVSWMTTAVYDVNNPFFGVIFQPITDVYQTTNSNCFVVLPEPGVAALFSVMLALVFGVSRSLHKERKGKENLKVHDGY